jgi:hypothetical protein
MKTSSGVRLPEELDLTQFKNLLRDSQTPSNSLRTYLPRLRLTDYVAAAQWLSVTPFRGKRLNLNTLPQSYAVMHSTVLLPPLTLTQWIAWTVGLAIANREVVKNHLDLYDRLSTAFLEEDFSGAATILGSAEAQFGYSIWFLQLRIALTQLTQGFEAQKEYARVVGEQAGGSNLVNYLAHYTSFRNESAISTRYFREEYRRHLSVLKLPSKLDTCVRYHLLNEVPTTPKGIVDLFAVETSLSFVDHFEAFLAVSTASAVTLENRISTTWRSHLEQLAKAIHHPRIGSIAFAATADPRFLEPLARVDLMPFDSFLRGDYALATTMSLDYSTREHGAHIDYDELAGCALAAGTLPSGRAMRRLPTALAATISKNDQGPAEYEALRKIEGNTPFPWAVKAMHAAIIEIADEPYFDAFFVID